MSDKKRAIDTPGEYTGLGIFVAVMVLMGVVGGAVYVYNSPYLGNQIYDLTHESPTFSGDQVVFNESYQGVNTRSSISKVYSDTDTEYGWCMRIEGEKVQSFNHFSGLNKTTPKQIRFSCSSGKHNAIMHTHPGRYGATALSPLDKETLLTVSWIDVSCVVGNEVEEDPILNPNGIKCFKESESGIERLDVIFQK